MSASEKKSKKNSKNKGINKYNKLKVALIGNMNNNNFALMRYFHDLGVDAHLLLYANENTGSLSHFIPENDSWNMKKWGKYIHHTNVPNAPIAALDAPLSLLIGLVSYIKVLLGLKASSVFSVSSQEISATYTGYDLLIGSGLTPATLIRIGKALDVFYPYSGRVEFLESPEFLNRILKGGLIEKIILTIIQKKQTLGIRRAKFVFSGDSGVTQDTLRGIGVAPILLAAPIVYNGEEPSLCLMTDCIKSAFYAIDSCAISIFHHSRVMFSNDGKFDDSIWELENKHTDWVIISFASLLKARPNIKIVLIMVDYGPDVISAKKLIADLGIANQVVWLPKMGRRELMCIISRVSICCGEFYSYRKMLWGGAGWEVLASGKPLIQGFNFEEGEFNRIYGYPPPPMLPVRAEEDVLKHLLFVADHPEQAAQIGERAREWFNTYNGIALAKKWLELVTDPAESHQTTISTAI